jgi:hypothetical protein
MAVRRPLVLVAGVPAELPIGDTVAGAPGGGGGVTAIELDVDFGTSGAWAKEFSISDAAATTSSMVFATPSAEAPAGGFHDELDFDPITVQGRVEVNGTVILKVVSTAGKLFGKRRINYFLA